MRQLPIMPGVENFLRAAQARGLSCAIASNSPRQRVAAHVARLGLRSYLAAIRGIEDVARAKPEPDLYEAAVAALGVAGGEAVAFEDSETGTLAAKRAGLWCVAVPNPSTRHQNHTRADLRIESLGGTTLAKIISELGSRPEWVSLR